MRHPLIEGLLRASIGLDVASIGDSAIDRALRDRMAAANLTDEETYARLLASSPVEMQELIEAVVVPETWFFRNPEAFRALALLTREEWIPAHPMAVMRVLSFPCSTGEEPYSIAMTLLESGLSRDRLAIDGFDISRRALEKAANAVYGRNSFRGAELGFRERHFTQEKANFKLADEVRRSVSFEQRNVVEEDLGRRGEYDVIFCRNVLIYFDQVTQQRVLRNLDGALRPAGLLFVGPAESFQVAAAGFTSVPQPQAFVFRKAGAPRFDVTTAPPLPSPRPAAASARPRARAQRSSSTRSVLKRAATARKDARETMQIPLAGASGNGAEVALARQLADSGNLTAALEAAHRSLAGGAPTAEAYHVLGLIRDATGDAAAAMESYRKALYLDPEHVDALVHLAFLLERSGDAGSAERFRQRARRAEKRQAV